MGRAPRGGPVALRVAVETRRTVAQAGANRVGMTEQPQQARSDPSLLSWCEVRGVARRCCGNGCG
jgi:hypothetical protein